MAKLGIEGNAVDVLPFYHTFRCRSEGWISQCACGTIGTWSAGNSETQISDGTRFVSWSKDRDTSHWSCLQNSDYKLVALNLDVYYYCLHFCTLQPSWGGQKAYHCIHQARCWRFFVKHLRVDHQITIHFKRVVAQTNVGKKVVHPPTKLQQRFCFWDRRNFLQWWTRQLYRQIVIFLFDMLILIINTYRYIYHILYRHLISSSNFPVQNQGVRVHSWFLSVVKVSAWFYGVLAFLAWHVAVFLLCQSCMCHWLYTRWS